MVNSIQYDLQALITRFNLICTRGGAATTTTHSRTTTTFIVVSC